MSDTAICASITGMASSMSRIAQITLVIQTLNLVRCPIAAHSAQDVIEKPPLELAPASSHASAAGSPTRSKMLRGYWYPQALSNVSSLWLMEQGEERDLDILNTANQEIALAASFVRAASKELSFQDQAQTISYRNCKIGLVHASIQIRLEMDDDNYYYLWADYNWDRSGCCSYVTCCFGCGQPPVVTIKFGRSDSFVKPEMKDIEGNTNEWETCDVEKNMVEILAQIFSLKDKCTTYQACAFSTSKNNGKANCIKFKNLVKETLGQQLSEDGTLITRSVNMLLKSSTREAMKNAKRLHKAAAKRNAEASRLAREFGIDM